jgi:hypothetical protein
MGEARVQGQEKPEWGQRRAGHQGSGSLTAPGPAGAPRTFNSHSCGNPQAGFRTLSVGSEVRTVVRGMQTGMLKHALPKVKVGMQAQEASAAAAMPQGLPRLLGLSVTNSAYY